MSEIYPEAPGSAPSLGEVYWDAYIAEIDGVNTHFGKLQPDLRKGIEAGAQAVAAHVVNPTAEDYDRAADEIARRDQPAKVIVVRDENGREHRYAAPNFGMLHDGTLVIGDKLDDGELRVDAARAPGRWASACKDDVAAPDSTATALRIARNALEVIAKTVLEADDPRREVVRVARDAAEEIFTETEL